MIVVSHRGLHRGSPGLGAVGVPENSIAAVAAAIAAGCEHIEVDVRSTADGHLVVMHDANLSRTTTGEGRLSRLYAHELGDVRLADGSSIPSLHDVLELCRDRATLCLDVKEPELGPQIVAAAGAVGVDIEVWSTHAPVVAQVADRGVYTAWISHGVMPEGGIDTLTDEARQLGARALSFFPADVLPSIAVACRRAGVAVMSGTPNDRQTWAYLLRLGTRAIVTDRPVECRAWLATAMPAVASV